MTCKCSKTTVAFKNLKRADFPQEWIQPCCGVEKKKAKALEKTLLAGLQPKSPEQVERDAAFIENIKKAVEAQEVSAKKALAKKKTTRRTPKK